MTDDYITREQFGLFTQRYEYQEELRRNEAKKNSSLYLSIMGGTIAVGAAGVTLGVGISSESFLGLGMAAGGVVTLVNAVASYVNIKEYLQNSRVVGNLEKKIEELKSRPAYQMLDV